jgi:hypothetical protein
MGRLRKSCKDAKMQSCKNERRLSGKNGFLGTGGREVDDGGMEDGLQGFGGVSSGLVVDWWIGQPFGNLDQQEKTRLVQ